MTILFIAVIVIGGLLYAAFAHRRETGEWPQADRRWLQPDWTLGSDAEEDW